MKNNTRKMYSLVLMPSILAGNLVVPSSTQALQGETTQCIIQSESDVSIDTKYNNAIETMGAVLNSPYPVSLTYYNMMTDINKKLEEQKRIELEQEKQRQEEVQRQEAERQRIENVKFNSYNIGEVSNITYEELYNVLSHSHYSNFLDFYTAFVDAEKEYQVNAFALIAIAGLESGWNRSARANNGRNNIVGMGVEHDGSHGTVYNSKYECIMDLARQLRRFYLTEGAEFYNGTSTSQINIRYSSSKTWYKKVDAIGDEIVAIYHKLYRV